MNRLSALIVLLSCFSASAFAGDLIEVLPTVRNALDDPARAGSDAHLPPVVTVFGPSSSTVCAPAPSDIRTIPRTPRTLRLDVVDTVTVSRPFRIELRAYDALGLPSANFNDPVTFECEYGVIPIVSRARWLNGLLQDTLIITRPGKNMQLSAVAGGAVAVLHIDVALPTPDKAMWLGLAEEHLSAGRFDEAILSFVKASSFSPTGDPNLERRMGKLYLDKGMWHEAQEHFLRAIRSVTFEPTQ